MKRVVVGLFIALVAAGGLFAQEVTLSGELKTGFYIQQEKIGNDDPVALGGMTNNDGDSGAGQARMRLDFHSTYGNMGLKVRFQIEPGTDAQGPFMPTWGFAYAYGNLFDNQLTISAGLLGESPWGTGGPRLRSEPETREYRSINGLSGEPYTATEGLVGIRFEYKPVFIEGLNIGFVLNQPDQVVISTQEQKLLDMLMESVVGAAYENDFFAVRVGYRFDSDSDGYSNDTNEGSRLTYRLEERVLDNVAEGMRIWLNGEYYGIGCGQMAYDISDGMGNIIKKKIGVGEYTINWLYWLWDTDNFTAKLDVGLGMYKEYNNDTFKPITERQEYTSLEFLPGFYYKFLDNLLQLGCGFGFGMEFGSGKIYKDSAYQYYSVEPQLRLNMGSNAFIAAVYNYTNKYAEFDDTHKDRRGLGEKSVKHSVNIRAVYTF